MKRDQVIAALEPITDGIIRQVNDSHGAKVSVSGEVISFRPRSGAKVLDVTPDGARAMVNLAGIPMNIAKHLSPRTFGDALSELLEHTGSYSLVVKNDALTDIVPFALRPTVDTERLLNTIEKAAPVHEYNRVDILPGRAASLEIVGEDTKAVARGELVRAGVKVNFSPMGTIVPMVQSYALVLACTNGMTSNNVLAEYTARGGGGGDEGDNIWQFFRKSVRGAYNSFDQIVKRSKELRAEKIKPGDRALMLEALLRQAGIRDNDADAIRAMAIERPPTTSWELQNFITYASSHLLEGRPRQRAQKVAADFADAEKHARTCPVCHRAS